MRQSSHYFGLVSARFVLNPTSLRFASASALLIQFLSRVQSQSRPEKDLMGSFYNSFGAIMAGFDNYLLTYQESSGGARVYSNEKYCLRSHHTNITFIYRTCLVSEGSCNMHRVPMMAKVNMFCYVHLLDRFRVNKGYTHSHYFVYCIISHCPYFCR